MFIEELSAQIKILNQQKKIQELKVCHLYLKFNEIHQYYLNRTHPIQISYNFLHKISLDVLDIIQSFLSLKEQLSFRLLSNSANQFIILTIPKKIYILKKQQQLLDAQAQELLNKDDPFNRKKIDDEEFQQITEQLNQIQKSSLAEFMSIRYPPEILLKVMKFVYILFNPNHDFSQFSWMTALKLVSNPYQFLTRIKQLDCDSITNEQIQQLQEIQQLQTNNIQNVSLAASQLFCFILICIQSNYLVKKKVTLLDKIKEKLKYKIDNLTKMSQK